MKKLGLVALAVIMTVLLSGCAKKQTLSCTQTPENASAEFNIVFKGNLVHSMDFHYNLDLSKYTDEQIEAISKQDFCVTVKESMGNYKEAFTNCLSKLADKHLKVDTDLEFDKVAQEEKERLTSIEDAKAELERQGYVCTIK